MLMCETECVSSSFMHGRFLSKTLKWRFIPRHHFCEGQFGHHFCEDQSWYHFCEDRSSQTWYVAGILCYKEKEVTQYCTDYRLGKPVLFISDNIPNDLVFQFKIYMECNRGRSFSILGSDDDCSKGTKILAKEILTFRTLLVNNASDISVPTTVYEVVVQKWWERVAWFVAVHA